MTERVRRPPGQTLLPDDPDSQRFWQVFEPMRQSLRPGETLFGADGRVYRQSGFID